MSTISIQMHVHQPSVLRHYSVFDTDRNYFDGYKSREACRRYATKSILPANRILLALLRSCEGRFNVSISISGGALDLFDRYFPDVLGSFKELADTGNVEFLAMPYHNSLACFYSPTAFIRQVERHCRRIEELFGTRPTVFRNSELIYGDDLVELLSEMGFVGAVCDGLEEILAGRSCNRLYGGTRNFPILLRNGRLSRDVSERFEDRQWDQWPLTAPRFAEWLGRFDSGEELVTIIWDYSVFGLRHDGNTGIFDFLRYFPEKSLAQTDLEFLTASQAIEAHKVADSYQPIHFVSSSERRGSLSAWLGNPMQSHAMHGLFALEEMVESTGDPSIREDWSRLQACEYFEAMCTIEGQHSDLGGWQVPPDSPYDAYINYMNIFDSIAARVGVEVPS